MKSFPTGRLFAVLPVFGFAAYPVVFLLGINAGALPLDAGAIGRSLATAAAVAGTLLLALAVLPWDFQARAAWAAVFLLICAFYQPLLLVAGLITGHRPPPDAVLTVAIFVGLAAVFATVLVRPWQRRARSPLAMNAAFVLLLGINVQGTVSKMTAGDSGRWQAAVDAQIAGVLSRQEVRTPERDIYYIVLDGFGRPDILQSHYGLDVTNFVAFLTDRGFTVPSQAQSNYSQTFLSLASTLNLTYLDGLAETLGPSSTDRRPLDQMIDRNALMMAAKRTGYRVFSIGSTYAATRVIDAADVCLCDRSGLTEFEHEALVATPLAALPVVRATYDRHRTAIIDAFAEVEKLAETPGRKFVFAHLIVPHPPFVFDSNGAPRQPRRPFSFRDGDHFDGDRTEYLEGYRDQTRYVTSRLTKLVDHVLSQKGADPVIVIHGDHGPGSNLRWSSAEDSDLKERLSIFAAYAFPGVSEPPLLGADTTPVTGARLLAHHYLGVAAARLPDASYFSTWSEPYRFIPASPGAIESLDAKR